MPRERHTTSVLSKLGGMQVGSDGLSQMLPFRVGCPEDAIIWGGGGDGQQIGTDSETLRQ